VFDEGIARMADEYGTYRIYMYLLDMVWLWSTQAEWGRMRKNKEVR